MKCKIIEGKQGDEDAWLVRLNLSHDLELVVSNGLTYSEARNIYDEIKLKLIDETTKFIEINNGLLKDLVSVSKIITVEMMK